MAWRHLIPGVHKRERRPCFPVVAKYQEFTGSKITSFVPEISGLAPDAAAGAGSGWPLGIECVATRWSVSFTHSSGHAGPYPDWQLDLYKDDSLQDSVTIVPDPNASYSTYLTQGRWDPEVIFGEAEVLHLEMAQLGGSLGLEFPYFLLTLWFEAL